MELTHINSPVAITAFGFTKDMLAYPRRMEWQGKTYHFITRGFRLNIQRGATWTSTVTCSDGSQNYCLRSDGQKWTLVSVG